MKYSLRTNRKKISAGSTSDRDRQFRYLCRQRDQFEKRGDPILSVDAKKRELIGNFKNPGVKWAQSYTEVNDHDFRSAAQGIGIPYGIYDTQANRGCVILGTSHETSAFAVSCLRTWWQTEGHKRLPAIQPHPHPGRYGRQQWGPTRRLEARDSTAALRWPGTHRHRLSLSFRRLQMESHRASFVQPDQQKLGSRASGQLREGSEVYPHHHNHYRLESDGAPGYHPLPHRDQDFQTGTCSTIHPKETCPAKVELHDLTADVK